jgi:hypothetical protein
MGKAKFVYLVYRDFHESQRIVSAHSTRDGAIAAASALHTGEPSGVSDFFGRHDVCARWQPGEPESNGSEWCDGAFPAGDGVDWHKYECSVGIVPRSLSD